MNIFKVSSVLIFCQKKQTTNKQPKEKQKQTNLEYCKCCTFLCHKKNKKSEKVSSQVDSSILESLTLHLCRLYMDLTLVKFNLNLVKFELEFDFEIGLCTVQSLLISTTFSRRFRSEFLIQQHSQE